MSIQKFRILTYGRLAAEFKTGLASFAETNNITIDHHETFDQNKLSEYNAIASFSAPADLNISHIKWIHSFGAGVDAFINRGDLNSNLVLTRTVGSLGEKIAEYCLTHILAYNQNLYEAYESQKRSEWKQRTATGLSQQKIAIIGTGNMGQAIARLIAKLGINVSGINRDGRKVDNFSECYSLEEFVRHDQAVMPGPDIVISTLPNTPATKEILTNEFFSKFSGIHFINVGRGNVVNEDVIIEAITKGSVSRATLDVFSEEPLPSSSNLWSNEKVFITPHQASLTNINDVIESFQSVYESIKKEKRDSLFVDIKKGY